MTPRRLLIVDDHPVFRRGLAVLFTSAGYDVVGEAAGSAEAVALARSTAPDVVLMDLGLPDGSGVSATARIVGEHPDTRVVVVTMFDDQGAVREALDAGAAGYVVKDAMPAELLAAVAAAGEGAVVLGSGVALTSGRLVPPPHPDPFGLTPRERDVLDLVIRGLTNRQIAERLGLSGKTIANHVSALLLKCGAADRVELGRLARSTLDELQGHRVHAGEPPHRS
ncbi:MAG TPA: response regulator transcription factor [Lapillicoccus sp.]|nr:response regulator transcription factor [Lapillicoccus sp.]